MSPRLGARAPTGAPFHQNLAGRPSSPESPWPPRPSLLSVTSFPHSSRLPALLPPRNPARRLLKFRAVISDGKLTRQIILQMWFI